MEDVLHVYHRDYGEDEVLVCMDEASRQQVKETRLPRPAAPGRSAAYDHEYERNGTSNLFMLFAPLEGWRRVEVTERRTRGDSNSKSPTMSSDLEYVPVTANLCFGCIGSSFPVMSDGST